MTNYLKLCFLECPNIAESWKVGIEHHPRELQHGDKLTPGNKRDWKRHREG